MFGYRLTEELPFDWACTSWSSQRRISPARRANKRTKPSFDSFQNSNSSENCIQTLVAGLKTALHEVRTLSQLDENRLIRMKGRISSRTGTKFIAGAFQLVGG